MILPQAPGIQLPRSNFLCWSNGTFTWPIFQSHFGVCLTLKARQESSRIQVVCEVHKIFNPFQFMNAVRFFVRVSGIGFTPKDMGVSKNSGFFLPKSSHFKKWGFSIIFTIHFGGFPLFLETPIFIWKNLGSWGSTTGSPITSITSITRPFSSVSRLMRLGMELERWEELPANGPTPPNGRV